jgi:mannose-6-phosphate isomerase
MIKLNPDNLVEIVWGGDYIEKMKKLPPSGRKIGESWECSAHLEHPSTATLENGTKIALPELLSISGKEILGEEIFEEFQGNLPVLIKFIDARENLSVQVHPTDEKAKELGEKDTGKTEFWVVLEAEKDAVLYLGFKENVDKEEFRKDISSPDINIAEKYLNAFPAKKGDLFLNPAGTIHAIGKGLVLTEIQQSSGITYRVWDWNRTPKRPLHIKKALEALDFSKKVREDFEKTPRKINPKEESLVDSFYFSVDKITLDAEDEVEIETKGSFQVLTCIEGKVKVKATRELPLEAGNTILVPASLNRYSIFAEEKSQVLKTFLLTTKQVNPVIFQAYDVRAIADELLTDRVAYYLGKGYGTFLKRINDADSGKLWTAVGGGVRLSTPRIRQFLMKGILSSGVNVYDVGITSTPELYFSIPYLNADGGINITASHNETEYNGLKQVIKTKDGFITSINAEEMLEIKRTVLEGDFLEGAAIVRKLPEGEVAKYHNLLVKANARLGRDIWVYLLEHWRERGLKVLLDTVSRLNFPKRLDEEKWNEIKKSLELPEKTEQPETAIKYPFGRLKLVIDFGNGSAWRTKEIYGELGAEVVAMNEEHTGKFSHTPDPIKAKYRRELEKMVVKVAGEEKEKEIIGFGHDEDGDRVIYIRKDGKAVEGDRTLAIQAKDILEEYKRKGKRGKPRFMGEVKFSRIAEEYITTNGGEYIMNPTGFAFIKDGVKTLVRALRKGLPKVELFGQKLNLLQNKEPVVLAAELSGHQMSSHEENWIFDDGPLAVVKVLSVIAKALKKGKSFVDLDEEVPRYSASPEINIKLPTNVILEKVEVVEKALEIFREKGYQINTIDGGIIKWLDEDGNWLGQALVRKSNTQPMLICRVEGKNEESKKKIEDELFKELSKISTKAVSKLDLASDDYVREILQRILG